MKLLDYTVYTPTETTTVSLFPAACIHRDDPGHSASHWKQYLTDVQETPHSYAVLLGDYFTWLRSHARQWVRQYPHDENSFDALHTWRHQMTGDFAKELLPIKDKIIGLHVGNHNHLYPDGTNDTQELCRLLGRTYLEQTALTRLNFCIKGRPAHKTLTMLTLHGEGVGGGATAGGDINAMINKGMAWDVDLVLLAHNHQKNAAHTVHLGVPSRGQLRIEEKPRLFVRCGCFTRGYTDGCTTYAEKNLLKPTSIGHVRIDISFNRKHAGLVRHEYKVTY